MWTFLSSPITKGVAECLAAPLPLCHLYGYDRPKGGQELSSAVSDFPIGNEVPAKARHHAQPSWLGSVSLSCYVDRMCGRITQQSPPEGIALEAVIEAL